MRPNVGAVGAKLVLPDGLLQHAGIVLGVGDPEPIAAHLLGGSAPPSGVYASHLVSARNVSAVTAACLAIRRSVWDEVGGMDADDLPVAYNDVDLCLKLRARGYDIVWTPFATLEHAESATRGSDLDDPARQARLAAEARVMRARWGEMLEADPFYGPMFDHGRADYRLADPPLRTPPWLSSGSRR